MDFIPWINYISLTSCAAAGPAHITLKERDWAELVNPKKILDGSILHILETVHPADSLTVVYYNSYTIETYRELQPWWKQAEKSDHFLGKIEGEFFFPVVHLPCYRGR